MLTSCEKETIFLGYFVLCRNHHLLLGAATG
jgi:hypothetical protein